MGIRPLEEVTVDASAVATISALTVALTQIIKRSLPGDLDAYGPLIAMAVSVAGVILWLFAAPNWPPVRTDAWTIGAGWVAVYTSAVGVYHTVKMVTATGQSNGDTGVRTDG